MMSSFSRTLTQTYDEVALKHEAKYLNAQDWKEFQDISKKYDALRAYEQQAFELEYDTRVEVARKRIINLAGDKKLDLKHRLFGQDKFDGEAIRRQARREVHSKHQALMSHLKGKELKEQRALLDRAQHQQQEREKPKRDFEQATNRRSGVDRRRSDPSSISRKVKRE